MRPASVICSAMTVVVCLCDCGLAQSSVWTARAGGEWAENTNWSFGVPNDIGSHPVFGPDLPTTNAAIRLNSPVTLGELTVSASQSVTISGSGSISFDNGEAPNRIQVSGDRGNLTLRTPISWGNDDQLLIDVVEPRTLLLDTTISADSGDLSLQGDGMLSLRQANPDWTGQVHVNGGKLEVRIALGLGHGFGGVDDFTQVNQGGTLQFYGDIDTKNELIRLNGGALTGATRPLSGGPTLENPIELLSDSKLSGPQAESYLSIQGGISGAAGIETTGMVVLGGFNSFTGETNVAGGVLAVQRSEALADSNQVNLHAGGTLKLEGNLPDTPFKMFGGRLEGNARRPTTAGPIELVSDSVLGRKLELINEISGPGGLLFTGTETTIRHDNSYQGVTVVRDGYTIVDATGGLGDPATKTILERDGNLQLNVVVPESFELEGGTLVFFPGSEAYELPIISRGGGISASRTDGDFRAPVILQAGDTRMSGNTIIGGVEGRGDLTILAATIDGAALRHVGNTTFDMGGGEIIVKNENHYTGSTTIMRESAVVVQNPLAFGNSTTPVNVVNAGLRVESEFDRDIVSQRGRLSFDPTGEYTGNITFMENPSFSELISEREHLGSIDLQDNETIFRAGIFSGPIAGTGGLTVHADTQLDIGVELNGENTYTGITRISVGQATVNSPQGLGALTAGTVVLNTGELKLNTTTNEPLTVLENGHIIANGSLPRLPSFGVSVDSRPPRGNAKVTLDSPGEFGGLTRISNGTLDIRDDVTLEQILLQSSGNLQIDPDANLTISDRFEIRSGMLSLLGGIQTSQPIQKTSGGRADFNALDKFDGDIEISGGTVSVLTSRGLGTSEGDTIVASHDATLVIGADIHGNLFLRNSQGVDGHGGLKFSSSNDTAILSGRLDLGEIGARIGVGRGSYELESAISGGAFVRTFANSNSEGHLFITGGQNTYTGETDLKIGYTALKGNGRLMTTSGIAIGRTATLTLDNGSSGHLADRIGDDVPIVMEGGNFRLESGTRGSVSEVLGNLIFSKSISSLEVNGDRGVTTNVTFSSLQRGEHAVANFEVGTNQEVHFNNPPALEHGIIGPWAVSTLHKDSSTRFAGFASYGPNGIEPVGNLITDINSADPTDNVHWTDSDKLLSDKSVNSLMMNRTTKELDGHNLTVESGGIIGGFATLRGGKITAGSRAGQELIIHGNAQVEAAIVDNAMGPVDVTLVGSGNLSGENTHTGTTRILGLPVTSSDVHLADGSVPAGGHLVIDRASVRIDNVLADFVWELNQLEIHGESDARFNRLQAANLDLYSGEMEARFLGDGLIRKSGEREARLAGNFDDFSGQILVENGILDFADPKELPHSRVQGGTLYLGDTQDPVEADIELAGGELRLGDVSVRGSIAVTEPSSIRATRNSFNARQTGLAGRLEGSAPLRIVGDAGNDVALRVHGANPAFSGTVTVEDVDVSLLPFGLGTGDLNLSPGSQVRLTVFDAAEGPTAMPNRIAMDGGTLIIHTDDSIGRITGPVTINSPSIIANRESFVNLSLDGLVDLRDNSILMLNGLGEVDFTGPIQVHGSATIDAQLRTLNDSGMPGTVRLTGSIIAQSKNSELDLVATGDNLDASFIIPANMSLSVLANGTRVGLHIDDRGQSVEGNGSLGNDVFVSKGGIVRPGKTAGQLTIDANLTFGSAGIYEWEFADPTPVAGFGWDQLLVNELKMTSTKNDPFTIQVIGLDETNQVGPVSDFDPATSGTWLIVETVRHSGFEPDHLRLDLSEFTKHNPVADDSRWYVSPRDGGLHVTYLVPSEIDSIQDPDEREMFVHEMLGTWFGDSNLDGRFDSSDLVHVFKAGEYEDGIDGNSVWATGDWDGDREFSTSDLVIAFKDGGFEKGPRDLLRAVPEPSGGAWVIAVLLLCCRSNRVVPSAHDKHHA